MPPTAGRAAFTARKCILAPSSLPLCNSDAARWPMAFRCSGVTFDVTLNLDCSSFKALAIHRPDFGPGPVCRRLSEKLARKAKRLAIVRTFDIHSRVCMIGMLCAILPTVKLLLLSVTGRESTNAFTNNCKSPISSLSICTGKRPKASNASRDSFRCSESSCGADSTLLSKASQATVN